MKETIILKNIQGKTKVYTFQKDIILLVLSIFGLGWIKLFIDGRITQGLINLLLMYTWFISLIHGLILSLDETGLLKAYLENGYRPIDEEGQQLIKKLLNIEVEIIE